MGERKASTPFSNTCSSCKLQQHVILPYWCQCRIMLLLCKLHQHIFLQFGLPYLFFLLHSRGKWSFRFCESLRIALGSEAMKYGFVASDPANQGFFDALT